MMSSDFLLTPSTFLEELVTSSQRSKKGNRRLFVAQYLGFTAFDTKYLTDPVKLWIVQDILAAAPGDASKVLLRFNKHDLSLTVVDPVKSAAFVSDTILHSFIRHISHFQFLSSYPRCVYLTLNLHGGSCSSAHLALHVFLLSNLCDINPIRDTFEYLKVEARNDQKLSLLRTTSVALRYDWSHFEVLYLGQTTLLNYTTKNNYITGEFIDKIVDSLTFRKHSQQVKKENSPKFDSPQQMSLDDSVFKSDICVSSHVKDQEFGQYQSYGDDCSLENESVVLLMICEIEVRVLKLDTRNVILNVPIPCYERAMLGRRHSNHFGLVLTNDVGEKICHVFRCPNEELEMESRARHLDDIPEENDIHSMVPNLSCELHRKNVLLMGELRSLCQMTQAQHMANLVCANSFPNSNSVKEPEINLTGRPRPRAGSLDIGLGKLMEFKDRATKSISDSLDQFGRRLSKDSDELLNSIMAFDGSSALTNKHFDDTSSSCCSTPNDGWRKKLNFDSSFLSSSTPEVRPRSQTVGESHISNSPYARNKPDNKMLLRLATEGKRESPLLRHKFMSVDDPGSEDGDSVQYERLKQHRHSHCSKTTLRRGGRRLSWRQAIFSRVASPKMASREELANLCQTDSRRSSCLGIVLSPLADRMFELESNFKYRSLWKKAIMDQILKNRIADQLKMKEEERCIVDKQKLDYEEITPCPDEFVRPKWVDFIAKTKANPQLRIGRFELEEMVKAGIPRDLRCEVWRLLMYQNDMDKSKQENMQMSPVVEYKQVLKDLTTHQHAILIDLGRTFPTHPYFTTPLGPGQLSLFNVLKAYSLVDPEVGYCQGLSFVAGALLLHMEEEEAFYTLLDLMYKIGLRKQYRPDMKALQVQMYQLSRLLHDRQPSLHSHLEEHEIPMLYAAPWFLTLFASTFPLGFVARVFDFIFLHSSVDVVFGVGLVLLSEHAELIRQCNSFEAINDFLKLTLPAMSLIQMERVFNAVQDLELERALLAYEVEYHVLQEEMMAAYSGSIKNRPNREKGEIAESKIDGDADSTMSISTTNSDDRTSYDMVLSENNELRSKNRSMEGRVFELENKLNASESKCGELSKKCEVAVKERDLYKKRMMELERRLSEFEMSKTGRSNGFTKKLDITPTNINDSGIFNTPQSIIKHRK